MKEILGCNQCPGVVCADFEEGKRVIGTPKDGQRFIVFPENVENCPRRKTVEIKQTGRIFDQIPP